MHPLVNWLCFSTIPRRAVVLLVALAWGSLAFCGEIHDAARNGDLGKVKALLKDNPDLVFSKESAGGTPLHGAAYRGHKDVVELLLASKADVNAKSKNGWTPLHEAAANGYKDVAELLLANKADVNAKNYKPIFYSKTGLGGKNLLKPPIFEGSAFPTSKCSAKFCRQDSVFYCPPGSSGHLSRGKEMALCIFASNAPVPMPTSKSSRAFASRGRCTNVC
jgi:hypothetical protein